MADRSFKRRQNGLDDIMLNRSISILLVVRIILSFI